MSLNDLLTSFLLGDDSGPVGQALPLLQGEHDVGSLP